MAGEPKGAAGLKAAEAGSFPDTLSLRSLWDAQVEFATRQ